MERRALRDSGIEVSAVGLGTNNFGLRIDEAQSRSVVDVAIECGINFFDTADVYAGGDSERFLGAALKGRRDEAVVATKVGQRHDSQSTDGPPGGSPAYIRGAFEASLKRLALDYVDVLYYHEPDGVTPLAETMAALWDLLEQGKARAIACSNFTPEQVSEGEAIASAAGKPGFVCVQNRYNLLDRSAEADLLPMCERIGLGLVPFSPLANGLLTGKYDRSRPLPSDTRLGALPIPVSEEEWEAAERIASFSAAIGRAPTDVAVGALLAQPAVSSVIVGATSPTQVRVNAAAAESGLSVEDLRRLYEELS